MRKQDFHFDLPKELIASSPTAERSASRLLELDGSSGTITDRQFTDIEQLLGAGDLLVFNNTQVIPARLFGKKPTGGKVEILLERLTCDTEAVAQIRSNRSPKAGSQIIVVDGNGEATDYLIEVTGREGQFFTIRFANASAAAVMEDCGHMPLPPYIEREDEPQDFERYQTVYAEKPGAVAAPTAGLHFDEPLLKRLAAKGVQFAYVTLHVGAGTYQPVKVDDLSEHVMHKEWLEVSPETVAAVQKTKAAGGNVVAVGTTAVRSLETAAASGEIKPYRGDTQLFINPGYQFNAIDVMVTNFHLPESTLIMLVSAFAGKHFVMNAYQHAIDQRYRFFSYGDAMFVKPQQ